MSFDIRQLEIDLPEGWSTVSIKDIASVNSDTIRLNNQPASIYYIDISSVGNGTFDEPKFMNYEDAPSRAKRRLKNNDIIISTVRPNLRQHVLIENVQQNWVASTGFAVVSANDSATAWYLYAVLTSDIFNEHLVRVADGGAYPAFNPKEIEDAIIPWPDSTSLKIINSIIKSFFNKIEKNNEINQTLDAMAQALFKSWFVDFDPVKAKMTARANGGDDETVRLAAMTVISGKSAAELAAFQTANPEAYAELSTTAELFPESLIDSELGPIPQDWKVGCVGDFCNVFTGRKDVNQTVEDGKYVFFSCSPKTYLSNDFIYDGKACLIAGNGSFTGRVAYFNGKFDLYQRTYACTCKEEDYTEYFYFLLKILFEPKYLGGTRGSSIPYIVKGDILNFNFMFFNALIKKYCQNVQNILLVMAKNKNENNDIIKTRDTLLPKLLSGEIDLSSFELPEDEA